MGLFKNLFSSKKTETQTPPPQVEPVKPKGIIKTQRHKLENVEAHMKEIMELAEKNEDYKLSKKALIEEGREDEKIYEYELSETAFFRLQCVSFHPFAFPFRASFLPAMPSKFFSAPSLPQRTKKSRIRQNANAGHPCRCQSIISYFNCLEKE